MLFIGGNYYEQFGLKHNNTLTKLTKCPNPAITKVFVGANHHIYSDDDHQNIWSAGYNNYGQRAIGRYSIQKEIIHFKKNDIKIKRICLSVNSHCSFFITEQGKVYGAGYNSYGQLGYETVLGRSIRIKNEENQYEPVLIDGLQNVVDIRGGEYFNIAVCENMKEETIFLVLRHWMNKSEKTSEIPMEIIDFIVIFTKSYTLFSTGFKYCYLGRHGSGWKEIEVFKDKNIIKFDCGHKHAVFLEDNGTVWVCGDDQYKRGTLGLNSADKVDEPQPISYFAEQRVKIHDIASGYEHNLALDEEGNVYLWGANHLGQCGDGTENHVMIPKQMKIMVEVDKIRCGGFHSYFRTKKEEHWLHWFFGSNLRGECLCDTNQERILVPTQATISNVSDVVMGNMNTTIILDGENELSQTMNAE